MSHDNDTDEPSGEFEKGLWYDDEVFNYWEGSHKERLYENKPGSDKFVGVNPRISSALKGDLPSGYEFELNGSGNNRRAVVLNDNGNVVAVVPADRSYQSEVLTRADVKRIQIRYGRE